MSLFDEQGKMRDNKLDGLVDNLPSAGQVGDSGTEPSDFDSSLDESLVNDIGFIAAGQTAGNALGSSGTSSAPSAGAAGAAAIAGGTAYALEDDIAEEGSANSVDNADAPDDFTGAGAEAADTDPTDRL
ncbi:MAG TPA: hypothetical protein VFH60_05595 [Chloroflexia bacterium]|nr:hypothetical protein [Chloroflexia bacterium]